MFRDCKNRIEKYKYKNVDILFCYIRIFIYFRLFNVRIFDQMHLFIYVLSVLAMYYIHCVCVLRGGGIIVSNA